MLFATVEIFGMYLSVFIIDKLYDQAKNKYIFSKTIILILKGANNIVILFIV